MTHTAFLAPHIRLLLDRLGSARLTRIVDVGASPIIRPTYADLKDAGACEVIGFEPNPVAFEELQRSKTANETYFPHAVGDGSRQELKVYASPGYTSVFDPYPEGKRFIGGRLWQRVEERIPFETVTLDGSEGLGAFDLLKIDIQGGELAVFRGGRKAMAEVTAVIVEMRYYRLYKDEPMMGAVDEELRGQGFYLHKFQHTAARMARHSQSDRVRVKLMADQIIDGDAVYLRDLGRIEDYSDEQLRHLCILAGEVFSSHSIVLHCLDELVRRKAIPADLPAAYVDALPAQFRHTDVSLAALRQRRAASGAQKVATGGNVEGRENA